MIFFRSLLAKIIVTTRKDSAWKNYEKIGNRSPINPLTEKLVSKLNDNLSDVCVLQAMRYTPPRADECIDELIKKRNKRCSSSSFISSIFNNYNKIFC